MVKKALVLGLVLGVLIGCAPKDENEGILFELSTLASEDAQKLITDERINELIKEKLKDEKIQDIATIDLTKEIEGSEILAITTKEEKTNFRIYKRIKKDIEQIWEKQVDTPIESAYYIDNIFPDMHGEKNFVTIGTHQNPGMYLTFFVLGEDPHTGKVDIVYDNHFEEATPLYMGEISVNKGMMLIEENGSVSHRVEWTGEHFQKRE